MEAHPTIVQFVCFIVYSVYSLSSPLQWCLLLLLDIAAMCIFLCIVIDLAFSMFVLWFRTKLIFVFKITFKVYHLKAFQCFFSYVSYLFVQHNSWNEKWIPICRFLGIGLNKNKQHFLKYFELNDIFLYININHYITLCIFNYLRVSFSFKFGCAQGITTEIIRAKIY